MAKVGLDLVYFSDLVTTRECLTKAWCRVGSSRTLTTIELGPQAQFAGYGQPIIRRALEPGHARVFKISYRLETVTQGTDLFHIVREPGHFRDMRAL